jgi:hypothetical protein
MLGKGLGVSCAPAPGGLLDPPSVLSVVSLNVRHCVKPNLLNCQGLLNILWGAVNYDLATSGGPIASGSVAHFDSLQKCHSDSISSASLTRIDASTTRAS